MTRYSSSVQEDITMFNYFAKFKRVLAMFAVALIFSMMAQAAEEDRIAFSVNCRGVLDDLLKKGYSPFVVGYAQDKDGNDISADQFETYKGTTLYVPKTALNGKKPADIADAKERWAAIAQAHADRIKKIGAKKYAAAVKQCEVELNPITFKKFEVSPEKISMKIGETAKFEAAALKSNGVAYRVTASTDEKSLKLVQADNGRGFTIQALTPGDHTVILSYQGHETKLTVHVEDYSLWEKIFNTLGYTGLAILAALVALLAFLLARRGRNTEPNPTENDSMFGGTGQPPSPTQHGGGSSHFTIIDPPDQK